MNDKIKEWMGKNWFFFILLVPVFLIVVFRDLLISILLNSSHKVADEAKAKDADLSKQETEASARADEHVKRAEEAEASKKPVSEDWYKNEK